MNLIDGVLLLVFPKEIFFSKFESNSHARRSNVDGLREEDEKEGSWKGGGKISLRAGERGNACT